MSINSKVAEWGKAKINALSEKVLSDRERAAYKSEIFLTLLVNKVDRDMAVEIVRPL